VCYIRFFMVVVYINEMMIVSTPTDANNKHTTAVITMPTNHKWNDSSHQSGKQPIWNSHSKTPERGEDAETVSKTKYGVSSRIYLPM